MENKLKMHDSIMDLRTVAVEIAEKVLKQLNKQSKSATLDVRTDAANFLPEISDIQLGAITDALNVLNGINEQIS